MDRYQLNRSQGRPYNRTCGMMQSSAYTPMGGRMQRTGVSSVSQGAGCSCKNDSGCSCCKDTGCACYMPGTTSENRELLNQVQGLPNAMAYVPCQEFDDTYDLCYAFQAGTIFPSLCKPFCGKGGRFR